eukprot:sb/3471163/
MASYPQFFSAIIFVFIAYLLTTPSKINNLVGSIANYISFFAVFLIIFVGAFYIDIDNWLTVQGGFMPYGLTSVSRGATVILSTYLGFTMLPCLSEEEKNPQVDISQATHASFFFVMAIYISVSLVVSLMVPYNDVMSNFAMSNIFIDVGAEWMKYCVEIGKLISQSAQHTSPQSYNSLLKVHKIPKTFL